MIYASMASVSSRLEQRENTIRSLAPQVTSITWQNGDEGGDRRKFEDSQFVEGYYFSCDDDLIYPSDYVEKMIAKLNEFGNRIIVTCLGRTINIQPIEKYYGSGQMTKYPCLGTVEEDSWVHIGGTGVMAFHTDYFRPDLRQFHNGYMADIWLAIQAQVKQVPILCMAHNEGWIQQQNTEGGIYEMYRYNDSEQVRAVNSIQWLLYVTDKILV